MTIIASTPQGLGSGDYNNLAFDTADLVISCGYDLLEYSAIRLNRVNKDGKKIIHMDFWPAEVDRDYVPTVEVVGDLADSLCNLTRSSKRNRPASYRCSTSRPEATGPN